MIDPSAARLEELEERCPDPRVTWLIGDGDRDPAPGRVGRPRARRRRRGRDRRVAPRDEARASSSGTSARGRRRRRCSSGTGWRSCCADRDLGNDDDLSLLDGADVLVKSPGVPRDNALVARRARSRSGARSSSPRASSPNPIVGVTGTNGKTTTTEWLGAMFPRLRVTGGQRRPRALRGRCAARRLDRLRALELPARGHPRVPPARSPCSSTSSPTTSTGTGRSRPTATRSCGSSRTRPARTRRSCRSGSAGARGGRGGSSSRPTTSCRPSPGSRARTTARTPPPRPRPRARRASPTTRSPRRCARSPASRTGSSSSPSSAASASSTTRRRRTPPPRGARSPRTTSRCT